MLDYFRASISSYFRLRFKCNNLMLTNIGCSVDYSKTPHACFVLKHKVPSIKSLGALLMKQLHGRAGLLQKLLSAVLSSSGFTVKIEDKSFAVLLKKSNYEADEWILLVTPLSERVQPQRFGNKTPTSSLPQQKLLCKQIHEALSVFNGIANLRWYFEGFHSQGEAVLTPDELTW